MDFFEIFAECAIAFTGLGAVHAALQGSDSPRGAFRSWTVVFNGALAFVLSILPLLLSLTSLSPDQLWRVVSMLGFVGAGLASYLIKVIDVKMTRLGSPPQAPVNFRIAQASTFLATLAFLINVVGWPWQPGALLHAVGSVLILVTGLLALLHAFLMPLQMALKPKSGEPHNT